jgi:hypothetical protein
MLKIVRTYLSDPIVWVNPVPHGDAWSEWSSWGELNSISSWSSWQSLICFDDITKSSKSDFIMRNNLSFLFHVSGQHFPTAFDPHPKWKSDLHHRPPDSSTMHQIDFVWVKHEDYKLLTRINLNSVFLVLPMHWFDQIIPWVMFIDVKWFKFPNNHHYVSSTIHRK